MLVLVFYFPRPAFGKEHYWQALNCFTFVYIEKIRVSISPHNIKENFYMMVWERGLSYGSQGILEILSGDTKKSTRENEYKATCRKKRTKNEHVISSLFVARHRHLSPRICCGQTNESPPDFSLKSPTLVNRIMINYTLNQMMNFCLKSFGRFVHIQPIR